MTTHEDNMNEGTAHLAADNERLQREVESLQQELAQCKSELANAKRELHRLKGKSGAAARQPEAMSTMATRLRDALRE
ncbi:hypothetical protein DFQ01_13358 [Paenibacillus cellulosilyticus]|uniref:Uncharacterized protein n=1 Tax=Paenibacillus cellulosilyticus TaxID=375489 RepID=A0A2V2YLC5_9BACL|nr:hypothetical protein [Paenibacillus cellulosilyticus]PWV94271.1 hypothetical protein DFQ01_13358 [Paenibacillus cellulosilyticus]QKS44244.1 hypothetical protein HUB94_07255 [Paenibacillus cellulosilyticus]